MSDQFKYSICKLRHRLRGTSWRNEGQEEASPQISNRRNMPERRNHILSLPLWRAPTKTLPQISLVAEDEKSITDSPVSYQESSTGSSPPRSIIMISEQNNQRPATNETLPSNVRWQERNKIDRDTLIEKPNRPSVPIAIPLNFNVGQNTQGFRRRPLSISGTPQELNKILQVEPLSNVHLCSSLPATIQHAPEQICLEAIKEEQLEPALESLEPPYPVLSDEDYEKMIIESSGPVHISNRVKFERRPVAKEWSLVPGSLIWLPETGESHRIYCVRDEHCARYVLEDRGFNHPGVILGTHSEVVEGKESKYCTVAMLRTFQTMQVEKYSELWKGAKNFYETIPIRHPSSNDLLDSFHPLELLRGWTHSQTYVQLQHIFRVPVEGVHVFHHGSTLASDVRLTEESYHRLMKELGLVPQRGLVPKFPQVGLQKVGKTPEPKREKSEGEWVCYPAPGTREYKRRSMSYRNRRQSAVL